MDFVSHHSDVIHITPIGDVAVLDGFLHRTAWLMGMGAIGETALAHQVAHLGETLRQGLLLKVIQHKLLDARRVDNLCPEVEMVHLGKSGGVFAFLVIIGNLTDTDVQRGVEGVHECRLAHTGMA